MHAADPASAFAERVDTLMLNVGLACDLACGHCHHRCSPARTESMSRDTMLSVLELARVLRPATIDVTGGEPALWAHLPELLALAAADGHSVRVRTNAIALGTKDGRRIVAALAEHRVTVLASLPAVRHAHDTTRGANAFEHGVAIIAELAEAGFGSDGGPGLELAVNPPAGLLPRSEPALQTEFAEALAPLGVRVSRVRSLPNMPLGRYGDTLAEQGATEAYLHRLADRFNPRAVPALACRRSLTVAWDGQLSDCDFNLAAGLGLVAGPRTLDEALAEPSALQKRPLAFARHCFACTVGAGSS